MPHFLLYPMMLAIGLIAGYCVSKSLKAERGVNKDVWLPGILGLIVGAKIPVIISYGWQSDFIINGKSFMGGLLGAFLAINLYKYAIHSTSKSFGDSFAPSLAIAAGFGKLGCFLNGCCGGKEWHVVGIDFFPAQLMESFFNFLAAAVLYKMYGRSAYRGLLFPIYMLCYLIMRFLIEFMRTEPPLFLSLTVYQLIALIFIPVFSVLVYKRKAKRCRN
ncbi:MAG: prolipoprotein diacylglyceryl transferase [Lactobacillales bacterium]|jgi:phosphatidylglycerol:prolipoprotein diacylglycerol transferase|nr:prolipoprotein diacylglyceryl transferase [Lactobacillales bacterium]